MGTRTHFQIDVGLWHAEIDKERLAHSLVIVLTGMNEDMIEFLGIPIHCLNNRRHFHKIGAGAYHIDYFHNNRSRLINFVKMGVVVVNTFS